MGFGEKIRNNIYLGKLNLRKTDWGKWVGTNLKIYFLLYLRFAVLRKCLILEIRAHRNLILSVKHTKRKHLKESAHLNVDTEM